MTGGVEHFMKHQDQDESLWTEGLNIVAKLEQAGHKAYLVGGCVRDKRIGRSLHDIDIATSALPEEVMALFSRTLPTGLKHGTITVMEGGRPFEVTTFRQETGYSDSRRPDEVTFVLDVREDLSRRDFTFNAMAIGIDGLLVDPFGGEVDLKEGIVRTVGEASERFNEDALRMLRAIRFAAEFDFKLQPDVWQAIIKYRSKLQQVAIERVSAEWDKMMSGSGPEQACHFLLKSGLLVNLKEPLPGAFREAAESYRLDGLSWEWDMSFSEVGSIGSRLLKLPLIADPDLRWAALLSAMGVCEKDSLELCQTLRLSSRRMARIAGVVGMNDRLNALSTDTSEDQWISAVLAYGRTTAEDWLAMAEAGDDPMHSVRDWLNDMQVTSVSELNIRGDELAILLGKPPGPWIALLLRELLEAVAIGELPNDKKELQLAVLAANRGSILGEQQ
jgi:tRNA nucleotidyltransferase (CCA-adding enzyme)